MVLITTISIVWNVDADMDGYVPEKEEKIKIVIRFHKNTTLM